MRAPDHRAQRGAESVGAGEGPSAPPSAKATQRGLLLGQHEVENAASGEMVHPPPNGAEDVAGRFSAQNVEEPVLRRDPRQAQQAAWAQVRGGRPEGEWVAAVG